MVREHDHPLNEAGYQQAFALQQAITMELDMPSTSADTPNPAYEISNAGAFWASPLTRALQTAIVALAPVLRSPGRVLELKLNVREKKNFGGLDSIGRVCGPACYARALSELRGLDVGDGGPSAVDMVELSKLHVDPAEAEEEWWIEGPSGEDATSLQQRLDELLHQIEHADADKIVIVSHSHYFRAFLRRFLHPSFIHRNAQLARTLQTKSVPNCSVRGSLEPDSTLALRSFLCPAFRCDRKARSLIEMRAPPLASTGVTLRRGLFDATLCRSRRDTDCLPAAV